MIPELITQCLVKSVTPTLSESCTDLKKGLGFHVESDRRARKEVKDDVPFFDLLEVLSLQDYKKI